MCSERALTSTTPIGTRTNTNSAQQHLLSSEDVCRTDVSRCEEIMWGMRSSSDTEQTNYNPLGIYIFVTVHFGLSCMCMYHHPQKPPIVRISPLHIIPFFNWSISLLASTLPSPLLFCVSEEQFCVNSQLKLSLFRRVF